MHRYVRTYVRKSVLANVHIDAHVHTHTHVPVSTNADMLSNASYHYRCIRCQTSAYVPTYMYICITYICICMCVCVFVCLGGNDLAPTRVKSCDLVNLVAGTALLSHAEIPALEAQALVSFPLSHFCRT